MTYSLGRAGRRVKAGCLRVAFLPAIGLAMACGGQVTSQSAIDGGGEVGADASGDSAPASDGSPLPHPPSVHRPTATFCPTPPLPPEPDFTGKTFGPSATFACHRHEDCTAQPNGRCVIFGTSPPTEPGGSRCLYSVCQNDSDCSGGGVCECGSVVNSCIPGNCRVDRDCASGYCSPSYDMCSHAVTGYYCHTSKDTCINDSDCDLAHFRYYCIADPATGAWSCPAVMCGA